MSVMQKKIIQSANYKLFKMSEDNRSLDIKKHKKLKDSMLQYGFLSCFPIVVRRNAQSEYVIIDGQHRYAVAESLNIPVYYVEESTDFDVAVVNSTAKPWTPSDYAARYASTGNEDYLALIAFHEKYKIPIRLCVALLSGTVSTNHVLSAFQSGEFRIKDKDWAERVAYTYTAMVVLSKDLKNQRFVEACMAACRVAKFDPDRLIENAKKCREKLVCYAKRDPYLDMFEEIYNYRRGITIPLSYEAKKIMSDRGPKHKNKEQ